MRGGGGGRDGENEGLMKTGLTDNSGLEEEGSKCHVFWRKRQSTKASDLVQVMSTVKMSGLVEKQIKEQNATSNGGSVRGQNIRSCEL